MEGENKLRNMNGIKLIALVVTIIVLLILAGVTVATLIGENGLLSKAQLAKERTAGAEQDEKNKLSSYEDEINKIFGDRNTTESISRDDIINLIKQYANPTGTIIAFSADQDLTGYLKCQGQAVSRTTYSALFNVIGTTYGEGDGSTTFNLPDLRGEFLRGTGTNSHTDKTTSSSNKIGQWWGRGGTYSSANGLMIYTSRPTNTSVLYCIKY